MSWRIFCLFFLTFSFFPSIGGPGAIPQVPSSIEIAHVKLKITPDAQREIQKDVDALHASEKYYLIKLDRANLYFPIIERVLKEEGVPDDIKYLSLQESALISDAVSSANAVGYWQFKDFTAKEVGLRVDHKIDERKNIVSATRGAARYFKRNNFFLKNWIYAVNAYLAGPAGVRKYVDEKNFGADRLVIDKNTHWYVKRFIAHVIAFRDDIGRPHSEGLRLLEYHKGKNKDLDQIARELKMEADQLKYYNKWLSHGKIPDDKPYTVIVPVYGKAPETQEKMIEDRPIVHNTEQTVYPDHLKEGLKGKGKAIFITINGLEAIMASTGDDLSSLAAKAGVSKPRLEKYNDLRPASPLQPGEIYYIEKKKNRSPIRYHVVQPGESLWEVSQKYGIKLKKLVRKNRIAQHHEVKPGLVLWLRKKRPKDTPPEYRPVRNTVTTAPVVARKEPDPESVITTEAAPKVEETSPVVVIDKKEPFETAEVLPEEEENASREEADMRNEPEVREEPQRATPSEATPSEATPSKPDVHEVTAGESLWGIARKYEVTVQELQEWNGLHKNSMIKPGEKLLVAPPIEVNVPEEERQKVTPKPDVHEVATGESLWGIARKCEVTVQELQEWNGLHKNSVIKPGEKLLVAPPIEVNVPEEGAPAQTVETAKWSGETTHTVQPGETLYGISRQYSVSVEDILRQNKLHINDPIKPGQELVIPGGEHRKETASTAGTTYTVQPGDSMYRISRKFNTTVEALMKLNNKTSPDLSIGEVLRIE